MIYTKGLDLNIILIKNPVADTFVNLHEDFYQNHKTDEYEIEYTDLSFIDTKELRSFSSGYQIVKDNKRQLHESKILEIIPFYPNSFSQEQLVFVPKLSPEFVLPKNLYSICSAITKGDILSVLFHGPA